MTKFLLTALTATALAVPAMAETIDIDDDGWKRIESPVQTGLVIDIDDDGWKRISPDVTRSDRNTVSDLGDCTQLEASAGLTGSACGVYSRAQITEMMGDN